MFDRIRLAIVLLTSAVAFSLEARGAEFRLVPVSATRPHTLNGGEIVIAAGGARITFEIRLSNWDPDRNGNPLLDAYQFQINAAGFTSGPAGSLSLPWIPIPCTAVADCPGNFGECVDGVCDRRTASFVIDETHPNFVFAGFNVITAVDVSQPNVRAGGVSVDVGVAAADTGAARYVGTLILEASPDALGTFTVGFTDLLENFLTDMNSALLTPLFLTPARVTIILDCNHNGVPDDQDLAAGVSDDCNANGVPDECEADCNENLVPDACDIASGFSDDCDSDGVPDDCELIDCNDNGTIDGCDIAAGTSEDCDGNGVPDECGFIDCNENGTIDGCDIAAGTSADCGGNGVPDECEFRDCNANGIHDPCDVSGGTSADANGNDVPDECERNVIELVPLGASGLHFLDGRTIRVLPGPTRIDFEIRVSGWDLDGNGSPQIGLYQAQIQSGSFTSGASGSLSIPDLTIPCVADEDCPGLGSRCDGGVCNVTRAFYIDEARPDFLLAGLSYFWVPDPWEPDVRIGAGVVSQTPGAVDTGTPRYAGTVILDTSSDARGTFTIGWEAFGTFWSTPTNVQITPIQMRSTQVIVLDDCNENGIADAVDVSSGTSGDCNGNAFPDDCDIAYGVAVDCDGGGVPDECEMFIDCNANGANDLCDILAGTSSDANGNGVPDECDYGPPLVELGGCRYLRITPPSGSGVTGLEVTSPDWPCLTRYVVMDSGVLRLLASDLPLVVAGGVPLLIADTEVVPDSTYHVRARFSDGTMSPAAVFRTPVWGDVIGPNGPTGWTPPDGRVEILDIVAILDRFRGHPAAPPMDRADLNPATPDGDVNILDVTRGIDAFRHLPYPFALPCP